jgi:hypothetical protein
MFIAEWPRIFIFRDVTGNAPFACVFQKRNKLR